MRADSPLRIAITGSAGVGKTTLAHALGLHLGLPLVPEEMRELVVRTGKRLVELPVPERAKALRELWTVRRLREQERREGFVADNGTVDFAAYALQHGCAELVPDFFETPALAALYDAVFVLPWGVIPYERDGVRGDSPMDELRYQLVLESLLRRSVPASRLHFVPDTCVTLEERVRFCLEVLRRPREERRGGFVSLVGAGPGDPGLLTVRARALLQQAEVVAYDALIPPAVLAEIGPQAERILVGHRHQGATQAGYRLHPAVLEQARAGRHVVRLKQGDPFIFGRGGEEAEELREAGIAYEVVPGVSAALGAAAYAGIPLTHRQHASDVSFVTGHDIEGPRSHTDWEKLGAAGGTLVFFMATRKLEANLARLVACGRGPQTPAAYIASATTPEQVVVVGTLETLAARVRERNVLGPPALVVVGEVVRLREHLAWFEQQGSGT
ncbi:uroporphyrinogen-III C-methyltransferase [Vitiosangium sp. GDMCC 1.1324]|uniref:uroporphyrinogen-III C-methyltransferase n=1 Tax=Vitiosangium sp. (strain GDMCC 1.1324) TaxID=2138576 RepID=UPI000D3A609C|nr:uroporphyrinogen-III C-methyltransferase [Vitiosangium sp. GDMCC 1.1324]PTL85638.1 uroporphyrinogen-III C-methyltransferase [Vitiosangium sp. GDMCC 1.1324]